MVSTAPHSTMKLCLLVEVPLGVVIVIVPLVAPLGTSAKTPWLEATAKLAAGVPLKLTAVGPSRLPPQSRTHFPGASEGGSGRLDQADCGLGGGRPRSKEKSVPPWQVPSVDAAP